MNTISFVETLWRDLKYGVRLLRLNPGFAVVAILSLALGIGANTAIFQLLDAVRLRTLPVSRPNELAEIRIAETPNGRTGRFSARRPMLTNPATLYRSYRAGSNRRIPVSFTVYSGGTWNNDGSGSPRRPTKTATSGECGRRPRTPQSIRRSEVT